MRPPGRRVPVRPADGVPGHVLPRLVLRILLVIVLHLGAAAALPPLAAAAAPPADQHIVVLRGGQDAAAVATEHRDRHGASVQRVFRRVLDGYVARVPPARLAALRADPRVAFVERDAEVRLAATQSDPPWGLDRIDQAALPLSGTYTSSRTGRGVTAYVLDTGINAAHEDFGGRVTGGYAGVPDTQGTGDCNGHGTHVAGTVGGGRHGVAKEVALVPVRVLGCDGSGSTSGVIAGLDWVTSRTARPAVANMSLGGPASMSLDAAVRRSIAAGVTYVAAAGNANADACLNSPARVAEALTVGATTRTDARASFSNFGDCVDFFAPGAGITSAWHTGPAATATLNGTSMAAPHAAGAVALVLEERPEATPAEVWSRLAGDLTRDVVSASNSANPHLLLVTAAASPAAPVNTPPKAAVTSVCVDLDCSFDGSASTDGDGSVTGYAWAFGDGTTGSGPAPSHRYTTPGTYEVRLTVTDDAGATDEATTTVAVAAPAVANPPPAAPDPPPAEPNPPPAEPDSPPAVPVPDPVADGPVAPPAPAIPAPAPVILPAIADLPGTASPPAGVPASPTGFRVVAGRRYGGGTTRSLLRRDGVGIELSGRRRGRTVRAELTTLTSLTRGARTALRTLSVHAVVHASSPRVAVRLRVFDWSRRRFATVPSQRTDAGGGAQLAWRARGIARRFVSPSGAVRVAVAAQSGRGFRMRVDQLVVSAR